MLHGHFLLLKPSNQHQRQLAVKVHFRLCTVRSEVALLPKGFKLAKNGINPKFTACKSKDMFNKMLFKIQLRPNHPKSNCWYKFENVVPQAFYFHAIPLKNQTTEVTCNINYFLPGKD